ncbi:conserved hypothetical protein [Bosea sp. 62]|jgi:predicted nuclease with RNAse H fold|uniref:hypothetical protein n=1 Tax=unclassified Bosea (in: a-proteobacteria) TaxID=2653178 RepID=UPI00125C7E2B|nr:MULTISPECIES: hypothetical protein [unclassified Bosea (in: a-proteobacteria)]CAD5295118.1 conserved hypothetical protein [Bosea sp. 21B]CAD5295531.1 conserved hypothetical protein [Bosea sp. 46]CAD5298325.1 conserved hypothetical protein [Bosea sp. 7B]VVT60957.1 conserved hypothetical protein [Bosea sp. EC-HK365B]VXB34767.1 conserved hypothetical protein [Bosea sp. 127]
MKFRPTKSSGRFNFQNEGSFELFVHMEADPDTLSYAEFSFEMTLKDHRFRSFSGITAYLLRHTAGLFVIAIDSPRSHATHRFQSLWREADHALTRKGIWLFATTCENLRQEPLWSNALEITRAAQAEEIAPADRALIVEFLSIAGRAPLRECARLCDSSSDSYDAVLKLVSAGTLQLAEDGPLSAATLLCLCSSPDPGTRSISIGDS